MEFSNVVVLSLLFGVIYFLKKLIPVIKDFGFETKEELPYNAKKYLFSRSEKEFLRLLKNGIDNNKFMVFPKVRLADFIEVSVNGKDYYRWFNKISSKHIDFLIWDIEENKIALAIELDGTSHFSEKAVIRDEFVNKLYKNVE